MSKQINLKIKISSDCLKKLEEQLEFAKGSNISSFEGVETVEDLISRYLEQLSGSGEKFEQIQKKMQDVLQALNDKGIDMMDVFNSLNDKLDEIEKKQKKTKKN